MPCTDGREHEYGQQAQEAVRILCALCRKTDPKQFAEGALTDRVRAWWKEHKRLDDRDNPLGDHR